MRRGCKSCALTAPGAPLEQYLFAPNELTHRRWRREVDKCNPSCSDNLITLVQILGGGMPRPPAPAAGQGRRDGLRVHYFAFDETEDDFAAFIVATGGMARRAAEVVRGVPVLHVRGDEDEVYAAYVLTEWVQCDKSAFCGQPTFITGPRPLGSYWFDGIDLGGRGVLWVYWSEQDNPDTIRRLKLIVRAAAEFWMRLYPDIRWDGYTVPRSRPEPEPLPKPQPKPKPKPKPRKRRAARRR